jgi:hypothetical protein
VGTVISQNYISGLQPLSFNVFRALYTSMVFSTSLAERCKCTNSVISLEKLAVPENPGMKDVAGSSHLFSSLDRVGRLTLGPL